MLATTVSISGCAVQTARDGTIHLSIDEAELIGEIVHSFKLADGNDGKIRRLGRDFSIKLNQFQRVIPIAGATSVEFIGSTLVNDRTVVVLHKSERNCAAKTQIISIKGPHVSAWDFGDCVNVPTISFDAEALNFDFSKGMRTTRFVYRNNTLVERELRTESPRAVAQAPQLRESTLPSKIPRYTPPLPVELSRGRVPAQSRIATATPPKSPASPIVKQPPKKTPGPGVDKDIEFEGKERKATITLILDSK